MNSAEIENPIKNYDDTKNYRVMSCKVCLIGFRSSSMVWQTKVFQNIETLLVLLMNYIWSREQKWYRLSTTFFHFPKDRNCDICMRTKITRTPCRKRNEGSVPRAEKFGDLITADHKVLSEGCESRINHGYAVMVQDLATR